MRKLIFLLLTILILGCNEDLKSKPNLLLDLDELYEESSIRNLADAAGDGDVKAIKRLIAEGISVNSTGTNGMPVLFWALREQNKRGFLTLLEMGADPDLQWNTGSSITELVAGIEEPDYLKMVMEAEGNPNLINPKSAKTPIFQAAQFGYTDNIKVLLEYGADIDYAISSTKITPVFYAVEMADFRTALFLAKSGANLTVINVWGNPIGHDLHRRLDLPEKGDKDYEYYIEFLSMLNEATKSETKK